MTQSDPPITIRLTDISVSYRMPTEPIRSFKEFIIRWFRRQLRYRDIWALRGVSLDVPAGTVFGLVGPNGAGKSTLLKVVSRVLRPTTGRVQTWGRIAPLLELGAGFDLELSGRENILLNGTLLGFTRDALEERMDAIIDFAELHQFIDAPLRTYSSGMVARLGFAIATDSQPDILIVDELLSVGDADFQKKSHERIIRFHEDGTSILLVSHNLAAVESLCDRVAWLEGGEIRRLGSADEVLEAYQASHG